MKTSILSVAALAAAFLGWPLIPAVVAAPAAARPDVVNQLTPVAIMVIHYKTHKGLPNMPIYITPRGGGHIAWVGMSDRDGHALLALPQGAYTAYVVFNESVATVEFKVPAGAKGLIALTIPFNPEG